MAVQGAGQAKQKKLVSPIIVLVIAVIFILWLMILFMDKAFYEDYGMKISYTHWIYIGSIVMIILIIVLLVAGFPARAPAAQTAQAPAQFTSVQPATPATQAPQGVVITSGQPLQPEGGMAVVEAEPLVVEAEVVEAEPMEVEEEEPPKGLKTKKPRLVEYPKKVPGGVYGDTIIRVDPITKLNLRTLLVRSCMICDRQGKCWEEIQDSITRDDFLDNIDCKKGLRDLRGHPTGGGSKLKKKKLVMKVKPTSESDMTGL